MQHFLLGSNIGLVFTRIITSKNFKHAFVTDKITERCFISNRGSEANYIAPLYYYAEEMGKAGTANLVKTENFGKAFRQFINEKYGEKTTAEQIFGYIYAVLYSPDYRKQYNELLRIDFARIPFDKSLQEFENMARAGWELAQMHLLQTIPNLEIADFRGTNYTVSKAFWQNEKMYINATSYFDKVSKAVFDYEIGSYQVLQKYLKERNEEILSLDKIEHLQNMIKVLTKTVEFE